jgi:PleD family two-component response regulator
LPAEQIRSSRGVSVPTAAAPYLDEVRQWEVVSGGPDPTDTPGAAATTAAGGTILVADDNADMRDYISRLFDEQWRVAAVADGTAALAAVRQHRPDLVVADVMMPGLDGFALLAAIRDDPATSDTAVILLSARAGEEATLAALAAGADDYVVKPFTTRDLRARVEAQLQRAAARQAVRESEQRFRVMADAVPQIVWIVDATGAIEFLNQQWTAYTGAPYEPATAPEWVGAFVPSRR